MAGSSGFPTAAGRLRKRPSLWLESFACLVLVAITWLVFGQTLGHDFVNFDDHWYVYENPSITRGLSMDGVIGAFTHAHAGNWHPLTTISHMLDCQLFGLKAGGHHFTNVLLHSIGVVLLFLVLRQMLLLHHCSPFIRCTWSQWPGSRSAKMCSARSFLC